MGKGHTARDRGLRWRMWVTGIGVMTHPEDIAVGADPCENFTVSVE